MIGALISGLTGGQMTTGLLGGQGGVAPVSPASWVFTIPTTGGASTPSATTTGSIQWDAYEGGVLAATYTGTGEKGHAFPTGSGNYWKLSFPNSDPQLVSNYSFYVDIIIGDFPPLDFSGVTNASNAWRGSKFTGAFPLLKFSGVLFATNAWYDSRFTGEFPPLDFRRLTSASYAWYLSRFTTFPVGIFNGCSCTNFTSAFYGMNLDQAGVNNILIGINSNGTFNGTLHINGGTSPAPTGEGLTAMLEMQGRGWTITTN